MTDANNRSNYVCLHYLKYQHLPAQNTLTELGNNSYSAFFFLMKRIPRHLQQHRLQHWNRHTVNRGEASLHRIWSTCAGSGSANGGHSIHSPSASTESQNLHTQEHILFFGTEQQTASFSFSFFTLFFTSKRNLWCLQ